jgi:hypothetical protein
MIRLLFIFLVPVCFLSACTKQNIPAGSDAQESVYFIYSMGFGGPNNFDSLNYSFVGKSDAVKMDTIWLTVRAAGRTADHDRTIDLAAVGVGTTAVQGVHYKLLPYVMPKDSFQTNLGVVLLRDPSLLDTSVVLNLQLKPSADFPVSMKDTIMDDGKFYTKNNLRIILTDRLIKPTNWDTYLVTFFGAYSEVKFRFITGLLGRSTFPTSGPDAVNFPQMQYYQNVVRNALVDYNASNGPLIDENGNAVVIP